MFCPCYRYIDKVAFLFRHPRNAHTSLNIELIWAEDEDAVALQTLTLMNCTQANTILRIVAEYHLYSFNDVVSLIKTFRQNIDCIDFIFITAIGFTILCFLLGAMCLSNHFTTYSTSLTFEFLHH